VLPATPFDGEVLVDTYDAIVVGARCAGSATAMLSARGGMRVLLVDRADPARDTLSTHALMRGGVVCLQRWGLLDAVRAAGTPPVTRTTFHYGAESDAVELAEPLYAPRRTVLDPLLLDAARAAGVEVRLGVDVTGLRRVGGRVSGIEGRVRGGGAFVASAPLTVGADGARSTVARLVEAPVLRAGRSSSAIVYGYTPWSGPGYEWFYTPGATAGIIPTNAGEACVWTGSPTLDGDLASAFAAGFRRATGREAPPVGRLRGFPGTPAILRAPVGDGWALVGDAGFYKDPLTAHGITDALRDAELLSRWALGDLDYPRIRDRHARLLFSVAEQIAGYRWDIPEVRALLLAESSAMRAETRMLRGFDPRPAAVAA